MKYFLSFTEWVKKREVHGFFVAWVVIVFIFILLAVSRLFYSMNVQTVGYGEFLFEGEVQEDGVCYTVKSIPEDSDVEIGEKAIVEAGITSHIIYRDQLYVSDYISLSKNMVSVLFPDQTRYLFVEGSDGKKGIWMDAENLSDMVHAMTKTPDSSWQPDLIPALHYADDTFRENYENPKVWNPMATFLALLAFLEGTVFAFLPKMLGNLWAKRDRKFWYDSAAEFEPSQRLISWCRVSGWAGIFGGLIVLYWSFYF